jgi:hypothetical protein
MASRQGFSPTGATPRHTPASTGPLRHLRAPAAHHRRTHAHEPHRPTTDAHGTARSPQPGTGAGRGPADPGRRMVGKVLTDNGISSPSRWARHALRWRPGVSGPDACGPGERPLAQPSKIQAADQLFDRAAHLAGHVLEDLPQGAGPQGLVGRNGEVCCWPSELRLSRMWLPVCRVSA